MNTLLYILEEKGAQTLGMTAQGVESKKMRRGKKYIIPNCCILTLRLLFVFIFPLLDFLSDVVLIGTIVGPALESTTVCVSSSNVQHCTYGNCNGTFFKQGRWSVSGDDCGLVDQYAQDNSAGCPVDQRKGPKDSMCYTRSKHSMLFFEGQTSTHCDTITTVAECDVPKNMQYFDTGYETVSTNVPNLTVCSARADVSSSSACNNMCTVDTDVPSTTSCTSSCLSCPDRASCYARNEPKSYTEMSGESQVSGGVGMGESMSMAGGFSCVVSGEACSITNDCCSHGNSGTCTNGVCTKPPACNTYTAGSNANDHLCQWIGTDADGICARYDAAERCEKAEEPLDTTCKHNAEMGYISCEVTCSDTAEWSCTPASDAASVTECANSYSLLKCKAAYKKQHYVDTFEFTDYNGRGPPRQRSYLLAPQFDADGYATNYDSMCAQCLSCSDRILYECGTRTFLCGLCQAPISDGTTLCCGNDDWKHTTSKQLGGPGICGKNVPTAMPSKPASLAELVSNQMSDTVMEFDIVESYIDDSYRLTRDEFSAVRQRFAAGTMFVDLCGELVNDRSSPSLVFDTNLTNCEANDTNVYATTDGYTMTCKASNDASTNAEYPYRCEPESLNNISNFQLGMGLSSSFRTSLVDAFIADIDANGANAARLVGGEYANGRCPFREVGDMTTEYYDTYWFCEKSDKGAYPFVHSRFNLVVTGTTSNSCKGWTQSFGVDMNDDSLHVASAAMSPIGIPLTCTTQGSDGCSECKLLPIDFMSSSKAKSLGAESNAITAVLLVVLLITVAAKELFGLAVVIHAFFVDSGCSLDRFREFNFLDLGKDSIVGLVVSLALSTMYSKDEYLARSLVGPAHDKGPTKNLYPTLMSTVWLPLEYVEVFSEILFSIFWLLNLYSDGVYDIPEGGAVSAILISWVFGMVDLWLFRAPDLLARALTSMEKSAAAAAKAASKGGDTTSAKKTLIDVTEKSIVTADIIASVASHAAGATSVFIGTTRNSFEGKVVVRLEYEAYDSMAKKVIKELVVSARKRWELMHVSVVHRTGVVASGEASIVIAASSVHRKEAISAVEFLINRIKEAVPIWKKEIYTDGTKWKANKEAHRKPFLPGEAG
eukprot:g2021.t1